MLAQWPQFGSGVGQRPPEIHFTRQDIRPACRNRLAGAARRVARLLQRISCVFDVRRRSGFAQRPAGVFFVTLCASPLSPLAGALSLLVGPTAFLVAPCARTTADRRRIRVHIFVLHVRIRWARALQRPRARDRVRRVIGWQDGPSRVVQCFEHQAGNDQDGGSARDERKRHLGKMHRHDDPPGYYCMMEAYI